MRIGRVSHLNGLAEAHVKPGFSTLAGLVLYASVDPVDIRTLSHRHQTMVRSQRMGTVGKVYRAFREYF